MAKPKTKIKLALFDIDGTIFRSSLLIELINELVAEKVFPKEAKKEMEKDYIAWLDRKGSYDNYIWKVIQTHLKFIRGKPYGTVKKVAVAVIKKMRNRVYRYTRDFIKQLKDKDYYLVAISGSPAYIVSEFASRWGFDRYFGSEYEIFKGKFTGVATSTDSYNNKVKLITSLNNSLDNCVDFKNSIAVGDTEGDVSMLEMVGNPIAMNPNTGLAKLASRRGWKIVVERKDVIYEIEKFKFLNNHN